MDDFVIARNPDSGSALPYLLRLPLPRPVVLKARETWPRPAKVYCHRAEAWPEDAEIVERVAVKSCVARTIHGRMFADVHSRSANLGEAASLVVPLGDLRGDFALATGPASGVDRPQERTLSRPGRLGLT